MRTHVHPHDRVQGHEHPRDPTDPARQVGHDDRRQPREQDGVAGREGPAVVRHVTASVDVADRGPRPLPVHDGLHGAFGRELPDRHDDRGAGEQATAKKPAPDIYRWVLAQLGLPGEACLAIEDSKNGVCAALGAGIPVLVTECFWTGHDDFTGAMTVLPDLEGIDLARLEHWHTQQQMKNPCNS